MSDDREDDRKKVEKIEEDMPSRADPRRGDTLASEGMIATPLAALIDPDPNSDEPMTSKQADELRALSEAHGEPFDASLTRGKAARMLDELKNR